MDLDPLTRRLQYATRQTFLLPRPSAVATRSVNLDLTTFVAFFPFRDDAWNPVFERSMYISWERHRLLLLVGVLQSTPNLHHNCACFACREFPRMRAAFVAFLLVCVLRTASPALLSRMDTSGWPGNSVQPLGVVCVLFVRTCSCLTTSRRLYLATKRNGLQSDASLCPLCRLAAPPKS